MERDPIQSADSKRHMTGTTFKKGPKAKPDEQDQTSLDDLNPSDG